MDAQRCLYRHGFVVLTIAFALGLVTGAMGGDPRARLWLGAHTTGIAVGLMVVAVGVVWPRLQLGDRLMRLAYRSTLAAAWIGVVGLGVFAPAVGFPSAISTPGLPAPPSWASAVVATALVAVTISTFTMCGLIVLGLRNPGTAARGT